jgi:hypothetical protein
MSNFCHFTLENNAPHYNTVSTLLLRLTGRLLTGAVFISQVQVTSQHVFVFTFRGTLPWFIIQYYVSVCSWQTPCKVTNTTGLPGVYVYIPSTMSSCNSRFPQHSIDISVMFFRHVRQPQSTQTNPAESTWTPTTTTPHPASSVGNWQTVLTRLATSLVPPSPTTSALCHVLPYACASCFNFLPLRFAAVIFGLYANINSRLYVPARDCELYWPVHTACGVYSTGVLLRHTVAVKEISTLYGDRIFITVLTKARH